MDAEAHSIRTARQKSGKGSGRALLEDEGPCLQTGVSTPEGDSPVIDAARYAKPETLKNGTAVKVRSIRPDDKKRLAAAFENLEPESIFTRFFHHKRSLTETDLKSATELDFENAVALVVTRGEGEAEAVIAGGRYVLLDSEAGTASAEVAFTVEEDYRRQGLASLLLHHLVRIARQKGIAAFVAEVLPENRGMLAVFSRSGLPMKSAYRGDAVHVTLSLAGKDPSSSPLE